MTTTSDPSDPGLIPGVVERAGSGVAPSTATRGPLAEDGARAGVGSAASRSCADPTLPVCAWCTRPIAPGTGAKEAPSLRHMSCLARERQMDRDLAARRIDATDLLRMRW